jgi:transposase
MNTDKMLRQDDSSGSKGTVLLVAMEMSLKTWRLAMAVAGTDQERQVCVTAGHYGEFTAAVNKAHEKFGTEKTSRVVFCYEAGREGFHPHRVLTEMGYTGWVIDSSSIEVNRRARRAKNDAVDASKILTLMQRHWRGESSLRMVHVPTLEQEDRRHLTREREILVKERGRVGVRIQSLLFTQGFRECRKSVAWLECWLTEHKDNLPGRLHTRLQREVARLKLVDSQLKVVSKEQSARCTVKASDTPAADPIAEQLTQLKGIGASGASVLSTEVFSWRRFKNRREVGACAGLTPTPYDSGESSREQGISKAGNRRLRRVLVEMAWKWLDYQPDSALSRWFIERFGQGKRSRRIGIVALARKLLIALWRYLEHAVVPDGAQLKAKA